ncbi:helix-turn-helix domain-containing protein [Patulibacter sp. SYSU D01012]|uniref:helix-turn-helix domain-containing protein n=1 Tax=Patulibacter sp. SYSU D01012 TaxID=2817381 RepID=UPI001B30AD0F
MTAAGILSAVLAAATDVELDALADALRGRLEVPTRHPDDVLTTAQAAGYLQVDASRIYELRRRNALVAEQDGRSLRFRRRELDRYLREGPAT